MFCFHGRLSADPDQRTLYFVYVVSTFFLEPIFGQAALHFRQVFTELLLSK